MSAEAEHPQKLDLEIPHGEMPEQETDLEPLSDDPPPTNSAPEGESAVPQEDSENDGESGKEAGHDADSKRLSEEEVIARALEIIARRLRAGELTLRQLFDRNEQGSDSPEGGARKLHDEEPGEESPEEKSGDVDNPTPEPRRSSLLSDEELIRRLQAVHRYLAEHEDEQREAERPSEEVEEEEGEEEEPAHIPDHPDAIAEQEYHEREEERNQSRRKKKIIFGAVLGALAVGALAYFASRGWHIGGGHPGSGGGTSPPGHGGTSTLPPSGSARPPVADTIPLPAYNRLTGAGTIWHATWLEGQRHGVNYSQADLVKLMPHVLDYNGDPNPYDVPIGYDAQFPSVQVMEQWLHSG